MSFTNGINLLSELCIILPDIEFALFLWAIDVRQEKWQKRLKLKSG